MRYLPRLNNGDAVPLTWPIALYRRLNHICWPLEDNAGYFARQLERFLFALGLCIFLQHNDAELRYLRDQSSNIDAILAGMPTYLVLIEINLRAFQLGATKTNFKRLLQRFYATIYVSSMEDATLHRRIGRQLWPTQITSLVYIVALMGYLWVPIKCLIYRRKDFLYLMTYPFDITPLYIYVPLVASNVWVGILVDTMIFGEANILSELMMHLNERYLLLRQDMLREFEVIRQTSDDMQVAANYRRMLVRLIRRNVTLNEFGAQLEAEFSYRIFVMLSFSTGLLCALSFKVYTNPLANYIYILWFIAKTLELLAFGQLGSKLQVTTDKLSQMYYESNWEAIVYQSSNTAENVKLMKLIVRAIEMNSKPFYLTGLKYFRITLETMLKILRGAFSYFTFLVSLKTVQ